MGVRVGDCCDFAFSSQDYDAAEHPLGKSSTKTPGPWSMELLKNGCVRTPTSSIRRTAESEHRRESSQ
jgi:hypothetical protein